jgi:STE24 endopeptidase
VANVSPLAVQSVAVAAIALRWSMQYCLDHLNQRHVLAHKKAVPAAFRETMDAATYAKSVEYTLAKSRFGRWEQLWDTAILLIVLLSGILPWSLSYTDSLLGTGHWSRALWLFGTGIALSIPALPFGWWNQFRLEQRFGFNTMTLGTWITDQVKGLLIGAIIGVPLLTFILNLVTWTGDRWWIWAWAVLLAFQLIMMVLFPKIILPLFNKLTPLEPGALKDRLLGLGERTGFSAKTILVMDGSKRSKHSNAFFTGFGRARKIVLFDTLITQLTEPELEAVLAHEIGHYKRGHVPKMLLWAGFSSLIGFAAIGWLAKQAWFVEAFGFRLENGVAPVLYLFGLLSGTLTFWLSPLANHWSRKHEYEADAYARETMGDRGPLVGALRKLSEKNLSNLTPHPLYSGFYYSHPSLLEREQALENQPIR